MTLLSFFLYKYHMYKKNYENKSVYYTRMSYIYWKYDKHIFENAIMNIKSIKHELWK